MRTLVIDSTWRPINFINDVKAVVMVMKGKVDLVSTWNGESMASISSRLDIPAIIRLKKYVAKNYGPPRFRRKILFARDKMQCQYCSCTLTWRSATIDHVYPKSLGGKTSWNNCVIACFSCNEKKANKTLDQSGMILKTTPAPPSTQHFLNVQDFYTCSKWHPEWENFIPKEIKP